MVIPSVLLVEMGAVQVAAAASEDVARELREMRGLGEARLAAMVVTAEVGPVSELERGYLLGLETARVLLATMPAAVQAGVSF